MVLWEMYKEKKEDILYSLAQLIAIKLLQEDELDAKSKLKDAENLYQSADPNHDNSILTRNWGYVHLVFGAHYQSEKKYNLALTFLLKAKEILKSFPYSTPNDANGPVNLSLLSVSELLTLIPE